jgi:hypothetical protein
MRFTSTLAHTAFGFAFASLLTAGCGGSDTNGGAGVDATPGNGNGNGNGDPADSRFTYVHEITMPPIVGGEATCCKDFGEISENPGQIDNALAHLASALASLGSFGLDFQGTINTQLEEGTLVLLYEHVDLRSPNDQFTLNGFIGEFAGGTTYASASAGNGTFAINPISYDSGGNPFIRFPNASLSNGQLSAGPVTIGFATPLGDQILQLNLHGAEATGSATLSPGGVAYSDGTLAGYLLVDEVFDGLNSFLNSPTCECLGLADRGDIFVKDGDGWDANCESEHTCEDGDVCALLADGLICAALPGVVESNADLNIDANSPGTNEGISIGFEYGGVPASLAD